jgi:hypothetical protein
MAKTLPLLLIEGDTILSTRATDFEIQTNSLSSLCLILYLLLMNVGNPGRLPLIDAKPRAGLAR